MRIRRIGALVFACAGLLVAAAAGADDDFTRKGYYITGSGVYGLEQIDSSHMSPRLAVTPVPLEDVSSGGLNVRAGYRLKSWVAFEIQYEWLDGIEVVAQRASAFAPLNGVIATYRPDTVTANAKFFLPVWRAHPYVVAGAGLVTFDIDYASSLSTLGGGDSGFAFRGGGGLDFYLTRHLVLNTEVTYVINTESSTIPVSPVPGTCLIRSQASRSIDATHRSASRF